MPMQLPDTGSLLPAGVKGLVVCGILAALMSSLASLFNSSAMLFTIDFYKRFKPKTSEKKLVVIGQMATVVFVILGILWIPIMRSVGDVLYTYLQDVQSVLARVSPQPSCWVSAGNVLLHKVVCGD